MAFATCFLACKRRETLNILLQDRVGGANVPILDIDNMGSKKLKLKTWRFHNSSTGQSPTRTCLFLTQSSRPWTLNPGPVYLLSVSTVRAWEYHFCFCFWRPFWNDLKTVKKNGKKKKWSKGKKWGGRYFLEETVYYRDGSRFWEHGNTKSDRTIRKIIFLTWFLPWNVFHVPNF